MARIDNLISQVNDDRLRAELADAAAQLRRNRKFGLVFEEHIPETALLSQAGIAIGDSVYSSREPWDGVKYRVTAVDGSCATVTEDGSTFIDLMIADLVVVKPLGEPAYPVLEDLGRLIRDDDKPFHVVINGENFHALQLLLFQYEKKVDFIYLDPPYNSGARDWKYNNDYVDRNDAWHHSKWLSFMEKRLRLAKRLLTQDGILVVTIDEHELVHLGMLLEQIFPDAYRQLVTIVINPKGVTQSRFSRVEEYGYFCFMGNSSVSGRGDDYLTPGIEVEDGEDAGGERRPRWKGLLRSGAEASRSDREDMFYPVLIDPERGAVLDVGRPLRSPEAPDFTTKINGLTPVWPVRRDGMLGRWSVGPSTLKRLIGLGYVALGGHDSKRNTWALSYLSKEPQDQIAAGALQVVGFDEVKNVVDVRYAEAASRRIKTVWHRTRHDAGVGGTDIVSALLGGRPFSFPKSVYSVLDTLIATVGTNKRALVLDFFAGSGTTLHATAMLNRIDGGNRQCIMVTNNEVEESEARRLNAEGYFAGDPEYEAHGIFAKVTEPRVRAAITGHRPDGTPVGGTYLDGTSMSSGFRENVQFLGIKYADPADIELGFRFQDMLPVLWMAAGAIGELQQVEPEGPIVMPPRSRFAVLLSEGHIKAFARQLSQRHDITHVWLTTDSERSFAEMRSLISGKRTIQMLYRDYLRNFRVNMDLL